jgi:AcrR family transcriptional regulator
MRTKQESKRQRILESARTVFAAQGFEHATIRDLARHSGVADGTIYNYFQDKDAILQALIVDLIEKLAQAETQAIGLAQSSSLESRVAERMSALHDHYEQLAAVLPVILGSASLRETFRLSFLNPVLESLSQEMGQAADSLPPRILMAAVLGFQVLHLLGDGPTRAAWDQPQGLAPLWSRTMAALFSADKAQE